MAVDRNPGDGFGGAGARREPGPRIPFEAQGAQQVQDEVASELKAALDFELGQWQEVIDGLTYTFSEPTLDSALLLKDRYTSIESRLEGGQMVMTIKVKERDYWTGAMAYISPKIALGKVGARAEAHVRRVIDAWEKHVGMAGLRAAVQEAVQAANEEPNA